MRKYPTEEAFPKRAARVPGPSMTGREEASELTSPGAATLARIRGCDVRAMETFAAGLEQDGDVLRAALATPWSNAQAEGQITKLKLLKHQMYGHARFELLRRRVLLTI